GAVRVLRDAHAPEDDGSLRSGVKPRNLADGHGRDTAHRLHLLRREFLNLRLQALVALGVRLYILYVDQVLCDNDVEHGIEQRHISTGLELDDMARVTG